MANDKLADQSLPNETLPRETLTLTEETHEPLGHFDFEEPSEGARRDAWVMTAAGATCWWLGTLPLAWIEDSFHDGSNFWVWYVLALFVIGSGMIAMGWLIRRSGDVTKHDRLESWILSAAGEP